MMPHDDRTADDHAVDDDGWDLVLIVAVTVGGLMFWAGALWWLWTRWAALGTP